MNTRADDGPPRSWIFAAAAIVAAMLANSVNADVLRVLAVDEWFEGFRYGWPLLLNLLDLAAVSLGLLVIGGVSWARQWDIAGLARPVLAPAIFAAILFAPALVVFLLAGDLNPELESDSLAFGGVIFPVFEEVIFRGLAIGVLMRHFRWHFLPAALLPSLFFGAFHMWQGEGDIEQALTIAALTAFGGLWFGWIYWKWGFNLWPAIFLHAGLNSVWEIFALGENALGGQLGNAVRLAIIVGSVVLTIRVRGWIERLVDNGVRQPSL
jgi:membrane protease YdiL (CAAX protease family)